MHRLVRQAALITTATVYTLISPGLAQAQLAANKSDALLSWAQTLQANISRKNTEYKHKNHVVSWGDDGNSLQCYTDCSGFIDALIAKAFNWKEDDFKTAFGHKRMLAYHYYGAITSGTHFDK